MAFSATVHVQTTIGPEHLATIAAALHDLGREPRSMSDLVAIALETLSDILVENGYRAIVEPHLIEELLAGIRHGRRSPLRAGLSMHGVAQSAKEKRIDPFGSVMQTQARALYTARSTPMAAPLSPGDNEDIPPSIAEDGEYSSDELREENE